MPPITRSHQDERDLNNKSGKKTEDKKRRLKKGGKNGDGRGGKDNDSVDSKGNIRGLIDYDYDSDESIPEKEANSRQNQKKRNLKRFELDDEDTSIKNTTVKGTSRGKSSIGGPNFQKYGKPVENSVPSSSKPSVKSSSVANKVEKKNMSSKENTVSKKQLIREEEEEEEDDDDFDEEDDDDVDDEDDEDDEDDDDEEDEDFEEDGDVDEDTDDDSLYDEDDEEDSSSNKKKKTNGGANILFTFGTDDMIRNVPQRHNMKKESPSVKKFVKLLTDPLEDNTIDAQIDQFKTLTIEKQNELLEALERRPTSTDTGVNLMLRILTLKLPQEIQAMILSKYNALKNLDPSTGEYYKMRNWLDKVVTVPFGMYKEMPVQLTDGQEKCGNFMAQAKKCLDDAVFGQDESKLQILQFISTKIANPNGRGLSLLLVGAPGVGKTSLIKNGISKAIGWPFQFISLGGDSDASTYTGHQMVYESSHCGKIVNSLSAAKSMSCVLLFDEVDKISATPKGEEVQNLLIHLTDPVQNADFEDKYLAGVPIDLSKVMFVFSANDISKIDKVLLDRLMVIQLNGYDMKQKIQIAENYLLPSALRDVNLVERVGINRDVLQYVIEHYATEESGVRELKRCLEQIVQKINMLRLYNDKSLPFYIKDFSLPFVVKKEHVDLFIKRRDNPNAPPQGMYV